MLSLILIKFQVRVRVSPRVKLRLELGGNFPRDNCPRTHEINVKMEQSRIFVTFRLKVHLLYFLKFSANIIEKHLL